jgi:hypothetical protein
MKTKDFRSVLLELARQEADTHPDTAKELEKLAQLFDAESAAPLSGYLTQIRRKRGL